MEKEKVLSILMQVSETQGKIIELQAGIIDELFMLLCEYTNLAEQEGIEPLLISIQDAAILTKTLEES